ncbi:MAG: hypothetical protein KBA75_09520, partial [Alphaproteobacteria bacterium]|nr:hypothetical protein [Alphaproteobacteria bacterium]
PQPVYLTGEALRSALREIGAPLGALSPRAGQIYDATVPGQELRPGQESILFNLIVHRTPGSQSPQQQPMAPSPQLLALERLALGDPGLKRHALFWQALNEAKSGRAIGRRQQMLLDMAWGRLGNKARREPRLTPRPNRASHPRLPNYQQAARQAAQPAPTYAAWVELQSSPALGNVNLHELRQRLGNNQPRRANPTPKRDDNSLLRHMRPSNSDTDSGDES